MSDSLPAIRAWNCHSERRSPSTAPGSLTNITQNASPAVKGWDGLLLSVLGSDRITWWTPPAT